MFSSRKNKFHGKEIGSTYVLRDRCYRCPKCGEVFCLHCVGEKHLELEAPLCPKCEVALELL